MVRVGLDIGSTTVKCVVLDEDSNILYKTYERHYSQITEKISELLQRVRDRRSMQRELPPIPLSPIQMLS